MFGIEHDKTWVLRSKSEIVSTTEQSALTETILDIAEQVATQRSNKDLSSRKSISSSPM